MVSPGSRSARFEGRIAGVGSTSGTRLVIGLWTSSPLGGFADVMVETAAGHRLLLAPSEEVADFVAGTYTFDEVRVEPVAATVRSASGPGGDQPGKGRERWRVVSASLDLTVDSGRRTPLGSLLRLVPRRLATSPLWCVVTDPVARVVLPGVRTRGVAREGRREYYGATDARAVVALAGTLEGEGLGRLAAVDPPCRFGFSSTPSRPTVTSVVTTVRPAASAISPAGGPGSARSRRRRR